MVVSVVAALAAGCGLFGVDLGVEGVEVRSVGIDNHSGRSVLLVEPSGRTPSDDPLPLVVVLHGLGEDAEAMARLATWPEAARDVGFVAVFPQGVDDSWNAGRCCGKAAQEGVDDVAFLDAVIAQMVAEENVDREAVYMTGFSNGAMMTYLYSCRRPGALVGAASVAGTNFSDCVPSSPSMFMQVSGSDDPIVPVLGGPSEAPGLPEVPSVEASILAVAAASGCSGRPGGDSDAAVTTFVGEGCAAGDPVRYDVVRGLGHVYPNLVNSPDYVAVDHIIDFWGMAAGS